MKKLISLISMVGKKIPFRIKMSELDARSILQKWSPCPRGRCTAKNEIDLQYDLQVIIPAYNTQKFIGECIDSVLEQKTKYKYLVTVVDDGSKDSTSSILAQYNKTNVSFSNGGGGYTVEIITQQNCGISRARNRALERIKATYVLFLDSDDVLPPNTIELMINTAKANEIDILQGAWYYFEKRSDFDIRIMEHHLGTSKVRSDGRSLSGFPWGKLYHWKVLEYFKFPEGFWFEDTPVSFILAFMPYRFGTINELVYGYRKNPNGITASAKTAKKAVDSYWITERCLEELPRFGVAYNQYTYEYLLRQSVINWRRTRRQPRKVRKAIFILTCHLIDTYFKNMRSNTIGMDELEDIFKNYEFIKYEFFMLAWIIKNR